MINNLENSIESTKRTKKKILDIETSKDTCRNEQFKRTLEEILSRIQTIKPFFLTPDEEITIQQTKRIILDLDNYRLGISEYIQSYKLLGFCSLLLLSGYYVFIRLI